jgi:hypothetical protein
MKISAKNENSFVDLEWLIPHPDTNFNPHSNLAQGQEEKKRVNN